MSTKRRIALLLELPHDSPDMIGMVALRRLLKGLLRAYGLRCIDITEQNEPIEQVDSPESIDAQKTGTRKTCWTMR